MKFIDFLNEKSKGDLEKDASKHVPELIKHILKVVYLTNHLDTQTHIRKIRREWLQSIYRLNRRGKFKLNLDRIFAFTNEEFKEYFNYVDSYIEEKVRSFEECEGLVHSIIEDMKQFANKSGFIGSQEFVDYMECFVKG